MTTHAPAATRLALRSEGQRTSRPIMNPNVTAVTSTLSPASHRRMFIRRSILDSTSSSRCFIDEKATVARSTEQVRRIASNLRHASTRYELSCSGLVSVGYWEHVAELPPAISQTSADFSSRAFVASAISALPIFSHFIKGLTKGSN